MAEVVPPRVWSVAGSYFEVCNCEAVCPCWQVGTLRNFAAAIGTVHAVRRAHIELCHVPRRWAMRADTYLTVRAETPFEAPAPVACGIPGLDRPGQEVIAAAFRVDDAPLSWDLNGRCGFATDFAYTSRD